MRKILLIGWKDLRLAFRDRTALLLMLAAPFLLTLGLAFVSGRFSGGSGSLGEIPVVLVNQDGGLLGNALVEVFRSPDLAGLVQVEVADDPAQARRRVDADEVAAAVIIPAGFSESIIPASEAGETGETVSITLYANPGRPTSVGVVRAILDGFLGRVEAGRVGAQVTVQQLLQGGLIRPQDAAAVGRAIGLRQAASTSTVLTIVGKTTGESSVDFDALAYMAPGMALLFLMFVASNGGRTLLVERAHGTLPRLLISPTSTWQVLAGKVLGIYFTGVAQMLILILASTLLFQLRWGDPLAVLVLVLAAVAGALGWGMLITALGKTPGQVSAIGSAITLTFGILGGSFVRMGDMPAWFEVLSKITPNAWGLDGFTTLAMGGHLADILVPVLALLGMGAVLFAVAVVILGRRGMVQS